MHECLKEFKEESFKNSVKHKVCISAVNCNTQFPGNICDTANWEHLNVHDSMKIYWFVMVPSE